MAETNLQVIQRASATMGMDNPEGHATVKELLDPDFVVIEPDGLPYAGTYRGPDGCGRCSGACCQRGPISSMSLFF